MEFCVLDWMTELSDKMRQIYGEKLLFIGLQGSYQRGEATDKSDIDVVTILEHLDITDLKQYQSLVQSMPYAEKACGFICGLPELQNWPKFDLFQLCNDTKPIYGDWSHFLPEIQQRDIAVAVQNQASNLYHALCHSFLYNEDKAECLKGLLKNTFFLLQAKWFLKSYKYIGTKKELLKVLNGTDHEILILAIKSENNAYEINVDECYQKLLAWCTECMDLGCRSNEENETLDKLWY